MDARTLKLRTARSFLANARRALASGNLAMMEAWADLAASAYAEAASVTDAPVGAARP